ncbi:putative lipid-transfer protein DIR1 [Impatiens glandulifera]|uniref:putative lipid-transfer protein DIR1 n=1 Tax=Impatiens glandulifera TaxID=253017 RepID=UPI001FB17FD3|nr:putative lipid-transfer protein DIR1 [Impatiens glandulifera]
MVSIMVLVMGADKGMSQSGGSSSSSSTCSSSFFSTLVQLIPCRPSVAPFSPIPPNEVCCQAIRLLGQPCLCILINGPPISGVDRNMAIQLPDKCAANFEPCK